MFFFPSPHCRKSTSRDWLSRNNVAESTTSPSEYWIDEMGDLCLLEDQHICRRETNKCFPNLLYIFTVSSFKSNRGIALKLQCLMWSNLIHYAVITVGRHSYIFHSWPCNKEVPRGYFLRLNCSSPSKCFQRLCHREWQHCANLAEGVSCTISIFRNWMTALWLQMTHIAGNLELLK